MYNIFESSAEYRYFFDKVIYQLPKIVKDGKMKTVDIALLSELFFLSQANRNTSNIINYGYYKKQDFVNVLYALVGIVPFEDDVDIDTIKAKIDLAYKERNLEKENKINKIVLVILVISLLLNVINFIALINLK